MVGGPDCSYCELTDAGTAAGQESRQDPAITAAEARVDDFCSLDAPLWPRLPVQFPRRADGDFPSRIASVAGILA